MEFVFSSDNRSIYNVAACELRGSISFHKRELSGPLQWIETPVLSQGDVGSFTLRQALTREDAIHILNGSPVASFDFSRLQIKAEGTQSFKQTVRPQVLRVFHLTLTNERLLRTYPKLEVDITSVTCNWTHDTRIGPSHHPLREPCFVTLPLTIRNPRLTSIAIETFKLTLLVNGEEFVSFPESSVFVRRFVNRDGIELGEGSYAKNLGEDIPLTIIEDKPIEGALQFIFTDLRYIELLTEGVSLDDAPFTLSLVDKDQERHTQRGTLPAEGHRIINP